MKRNTITVALVGFGYWGPNLLRNLLNDPRCNVAAVCDIDISRVKKLTQLYSDFLITDSYQEIVENKSIDAVILATPPSTHFTLAKQALLAGKDVLVEKPLATSVADAKELVALARKKGRILMVDHTFVYSKPVEVMKKLVKNKRFGEIVAIDSVRINLGLYQRDVNVVQDLAVHDFTILDYILEEKPQAISVVGSKHFDSKQEDQAYLHLWYPGNMMVHINVSWLSPIKERRMIVCGTKQMLVFDDMEAVEKVRLFDTGVTIERDEEEIFNLKVGYRKGNIFSPNITLKEPLTSVITDFISSIKTRKIPRSSGESGYRVVSILDAAMNSLKKNGERVIIS